MPIMREMESKHREGQRKGPEAGAGCAHLRSASLVRVRKWTVGVDLRRALWDVGKTLTFLLSEVGAMDRSLLDREM